jgi:hypothetical protein
MRTDLCAILGEVFDKKVPELRENRLRSPVDAPKNIETMTFGGSYA